MHVDAVRMENAIKQKSVHAYQDFMEANANTLNHSLKVLQKAWEIISQI